MNTKLKIAGGIAVGLLVGATLMGTAFGATRVVADAPYGRGMFSSRAATSSIEASGTYRSMLEFMDRYRTPNGSYDMLRMMDDVAAGTVAGGRGVMGALGYRMMGGAPHAAPQAAPAPYGYTPPQGNTAPRPYRGRGMMGGTYVPAPGSMMGGSNR